MKKNKSKSKSPEAEESKCCNEPSLALFAKFLFMPSRSLITLTGIQYKDISCYNPIW